MWRLWLIGYYTVTRLLRMSSSRFIRVFSRALWMQSTAWAWKSLQYCFKLFCQSYTATHSNCAASVHCSCATVISSFLIASAPTASPSHASLTSATKIAYFGRHSKTTTSINRTVTMRQWLSLLISMESVGLFKRRSFAFALPTQTPTMTCATA